MKKALFAILSIVAVSIGCKGQIPQVPAKQLKLNNVPGFGLTYLSGSNQIAWGTPVTNNYLGIDFNAIPIDSATAFVIGDSLYTNSENLYNPFICLLNKAPVLGGGNVIFLSTSNITNPNITTNIGRGYSIIQMADSLIDITASTTEGNSHDGFKNIKIYGRENIPITITTVDGTGMVYDDDYSSKFQSHSIVDKQYVDGKMIGDFHDFSTITDGTRTEFVVSPYHGLSPQLLPGDKPSAIIITPTSEAAANARFYVSDRNNVDFTVKVSSGGVVPPSGSTVTFDYVIVR